METVLRLHQVLSDEFEGRHGEQAGVRLHLILLMYAALLSLLVSRELLALVTECADDDVVFTRTLGGDLPVARPAHPRRFG